MDGDGETPGHQLSDSKTEAHLTRFQELFGVTKDDLRSQGVDPDKYAMDHIREATEKNGPPSYKARRRYYSWRFRTYVAFIVVGLLIAILGGPSGPFGSALFRRLVVIGVLAGALAVFVVQDLRARRRYRRAMRDEAAAETAGASRPEFRKIGVDLGRGRHDITFRASKFATVSVHTGKLVLSGSDDQILADVDVADVRATVPKMFCGTAVKLDLGPHGHWLASFLTRGGLADDARSDARHLLRALRDAQQVNLGGPPIPPAPGSRSG
jgi:hypothetical protein